MDGHLRKLEREGGDETQILATRLRSGFINEKQLTLAIALGDQASSKVLKLSAEKFSLNEGLLGDWLHDVKSIAGEGSVFRAVLAGFKLILPAFEQWEKIAPDSSSIEIDPKKILFLLAQYGLTGEKKLLEELETLKKDFEAYSSELVQTYVNAHDQIFYSAMAVRNALEGFGMLISALKKEDSISIEMCAGYITEAFRLSQEDRDVQYDDVIKNAFIQELLPWAKGEFDPLKRISDTKAI